MNTEKKCTPIERAWKRMPLLIFVTFFIAANPIYSQKVAPGIEWQKCLGGTGNDYAACIIQTSDGGFAIAANTNSNDGNVSGFHGGSIGDGWVVKLDAYQSIEWQKCLGGSGNDGISSIIRTSDGGYAVAGGTTSNDGDVSGNHGGGDAWVVKLDSMGNIQWQKCFGGTGDDVALSIVEAKDEGRGFVIAGRTNSINGDVQGKHIGTGDSAYDAWVVRLTSSGTIVWQKCLGGTGHDEAWAVISADAGYVIAGNTQSNDGDVLGYHGGEDAWVVKLNSSGNIQWQKCLGGTRNENAHSIIKTFDGGYIVAGETESNDGDVSGYHQNSKFLTNDAWIVKLNSTGNIEWQKCLGGSKGDLATAIIQTSDSDYVFTGSTSSNDGDVSGYHGGIGGQIWAVNLDPLGKLIWQKCLGGTYDDQGNFIIHTFDGGYIVAGLAQSIDGDVSGSHQDGNHYPDAWIIKLNNTDGVGSTIENDNTDLIQKYFLRIYPNPASNEVHLELKSASLVKQVEFYDILGMQHFPIYLIENNIATVDVRNFSPGVYLTRVTWLHKGVTGTYSLPLIVQH